MKAHLLFQEKDLDLDGALPRHHADLIADLDLERLFGAMAHGDTFLFDVARRVVLLSLDDPEEILYRQHVLRDCLAQPGIVREMYAIAGRALEDKRRLWGYSWRYPGSILSGAVTQLEAFVVRLKELRKVADDHLEAFESEGFRTLLGALRRELDDDYFETIGHHLRELRFRDGHRISMGLDRDNSGVDYVLRSPRVRKAGWKERLGIGEHHSYSFRVPPRDEAGLNALSDITNRGVNLVANAAAQSADHVLSYFTMLRAELGFYVGCLNLREQLDAKAQAITFPQPVGRDEGGLSASNLRDVCLALRSEDPVVGNDLDADGKSLVVITGANSGGKSTFLRSVGLAHLMMQCGMFVTADAFRASVSQAIFTHFTRDEDETMTSGRLDQELSRMSTIADEIRPQSLILFNESFAATNEREGSEIGRQIVRALLEAGIRVCFVTHRYDLAESFSRERPATTLFLRAPRGEDSRRPFALEVAGPLPTSFGEDLYRRLGGWLPEDRGSSAPRPATVESGGPPRAGG